MSFRSIRKAFSSISAKPGTQLGLSGTTVAVGLAALAAVSLAIVQLATSGTSSAQAGIPGLVG
ncbi:MAG: hypothetical protein O3B95_02945 [Chloroflexi bacterium]|nr:hypothetical protein [Chloroflexota bacterium]